MSRAPPGQSSPDGAGREWGSPGGGPGLGACARPRAVVSSGQHPDPRGPELRPGRSPQKGGELWPGSRQTAFDPNCPGAFGPSGQSAGSRLQVTPGGRARAPRGREGLVREPAERRLPEGLGGLWGKDFPAWLNAENTKHKPLHFGLGKPNKPEWRWQ